MNLIFDLDGTLIDSAPTILLGLQRVIEVSGLTPVIPLGTSLIGPPLKETLASLFGNKQAMDLDALVHEFKTYYDHEAYQATQVYDGVDALLQELKKSGDTLYLATNKRYAPTKKIVTHLGWDALFEDVYAIDKYLEKPFVNKAAMLTCLQTEHAIEVAQALYIGDRLEDKEAAEHNAIPTILVNWGYGDLEKQDKDPALLIASSTKDLLQMIASYR
jgi:phosphoglycolate phosphatase